MLIPNGNYSLPGPCTLLAVISCPGVCAGEQLSLDKATARWGSMLAPYPPLCAIPAHCSGGALGGTSHALSVLPLQGIAESEEGKDWVLPLGKILSPNLGRRALAPPWPEHLTCAQLTCGAGRVCFC